MLQECSCMRPCMRPEQTLLAQYFEHLLTEFDQTFTTDEFLARMNASNFGVISSRVKVTVGSNMPQNALFGFKLGKGKVQYLL